MFGVQFLIKIILLWTLANIALMESVRRKKDVHHMIILKEPIKSYRHKNHHMLNTRSKKNRHKHYSSEESSLESLEESDEDYTRTTKRPKFKREHKNHHKNHKKHNGKHHNSDFHSFTNGKWVPMTSQELFGKTSPPSIYSGGIHNGDIHYSQAVPIEITTSYPLYPPLDSDFTNKITKPTLADTPLIGTVESYKPFDYSILEKKPTLVTPISIIVEENNNLKQNKEANNNNNLEPINQTFQRQRGRGTSRFRLKRKNPQ